MGPGLVEPVNSVQEVAAGADVVTRDEDSAQIVVGGRFPRPKKLLGTHLQKLSNPFLQHHGVPPGSLAV